MWCLCTHTTCVHDDVLTPSRFHHTRTLQGGSAATTEWSIHTWQQYYDLCRDFARALIKLEFKVGRCVWWPWGLCSGRRCWGPWGGWIGWIGT